jgi:hypothetical protein
VVSLLYLCSTPVVEGLYLLLKAIQSINDVKPMSEELVLSRGYAGVLHAAEMAGRYDGPIVFRLLSDAIRSPTLNNKLLIFTIWLKAGVRERVSEAARATIGEHILLANPAIIHDIKEHNLSNWTRLLELHLRRTTPLPKGFLPSHIEQSMHNLTIDTH